MCGAGADERVRIGDRFILRSLLAGTNGCTHADAAKVLVKDSWKGKEPPHGSTIGFQSMRNSTYVCSLGAH